MKSVEELSDMGTPDFRYIGNRFRMLREEFLAIDRKRGKLDKESIYTRENLSNTLKISNSTLRNIEKSGSLSHNTIKLILFFYMRGINPIWILNPDNSLDNKHYVPLEYVDDKMEVKENFGELENNIVALLQSFKELL